MQLFYTNMQKNLANHQVITYGGHTAPIEGATDFLWMIIIAILKKMGIAEFYSALALNFFATVILLTLFKEKLARFVIFLSILFTPFLYSSLLGFSTLFLVLSTYIVSR